MAETAANNPADALSSPGSVNGNGNVNGGQRPWDQATATAYGQDYANTFPSRSRTSHESTAAYPKYSHKHTASYGLNGASRSRTSSRSGSRQGHLHEPSYLAPHRVVDPLNRKDHSLPRTASDADSILDLYGRPSANHSTASVMEFPEKKPENKPVVVEGPDPDESHWIHRDKLAKIESEELQQFGIRVRDPSLIGRKSGSRRGRSRESHSITTTTTTIANGTVERNNSSPVIFEHDGGEQQRLDSPILIDDNSQEDEEEGGPVIFDDPRLPEEIAADQQYYEASGGSRVYRMPGLRKSASRIPVLASSPHPIAHEHLERESPLQRTRNNTVSSGDEEGFTYTKSRRPSVSASRVLQTPEPQLDTTPPHSIQATSSTTQQIQNSPSKPKQTGTGKPTTTSRRTSGAETRKVSGTHRKTITTTTNHTNNHNNNGSSSNHHHQRPTTRSGERRPTTAINRPEGDPPWLATMYKPDPRLPPDQQILPTHAKKLQQEMWEKEGKIPSTYDKDFAPLVIRDDDEQLRLPAAGNVKEKAGVEEPATIMLEPLPLVKSPGSDPGTNRPSEIDRRRKSTQAPVGTTSTMSPPGPPTTMFTPTISVRPGPPPVVVQAEPEPVKKKGCSCCIVM